MKIAVIGSRGFLSRYGGIEVSIYETVSRLAAAGHTISVYCRKQQNQRPAEGMSPRITLVYLPSVRTKHLETFVHAFFSTCHACFSGAEVVHFHALGPAFFSCIPRLFGKKTVVTIHAVDWQRKKWGLAARLFLKGCEYPAVFSPHKTIVVSSVLKEYFEKKFKKEMCLIPNGVAAACRTHQKNSDPRDSEFILFVGRLVPEKGLHYLISAFNALAGAKKLVIAGEPSFTEGYARRLRSMASKKVEFLGFVPGDRLEELYRRAYLFVLPSEIEGSSVSLLEAMGQGKCVLTSDIPESREIVGDCGFYFRNKDAADLEHQLRFLMAHPEKVNEAGERARARVRERYNWDDITRKIEALYAAVLNQ
jgi:glycosyltransferase involved in cell wall biosynthesis